MLKINNIINFTFKILMAFIIFFGMPVKAEMVNGEDLIDPTLPLTLSIGNSALTQSNGESDFELSSILIRGDIRIAVINSTRYRQGDRIGNGEIINIDNASVTLRIGREDRVLPLHGNSIKKISTRNN